ncbi:MAG: HD domain-containing phosphohydrolase [Halothermotrichaceae bacterium]
MFLEKCKKLFNNIKKVSRYKFWYRASRFMLERKIEESKRKYKYLFNEIPLGIIEIDNQGKITNYNNKIVEIFGNIDNKSNILNEIKHYLGDKWEAVLSGKTVSDIVEYNVSDNQQKWLSYIVKPVLISDGNKKFIITCQDITEKEQIKNKLKYLSFHDPLTGLKNRAFLNKKIYEYNSSEFFPLSILMADINGLKLANDVFGNDKGDQILIAVAKVIRDCSRSQDIAARWGGDEFLILMPNTDKEEVRTLINKISCKLKNIKVGPIKPSISFGYAVKSKIYKDISEVLKKAEEQMNKNKLEESQNAQSTIIASLKDTLSETTNETSKHCQRLRQIAIKIGKAIKLSEQELVELGLLAELHDLGKIAVSKDILHKKDILTTEEWDVIKTHTEIGYKVASSSTELSKIADGILSHHEWWDGTGYPRQLKGKEIPLLARIVAIADAFDVMTHKRAYKDEMNIDNAVKELIMGAGEQFDPELVNIFVNKVLKEDILSEN